MERTVLKIARQNVLKSHIISFLVAYVTERASVSMWVENLMGVRKRAKYLRVCKSTVLSTPLPFPRDDTDLTDFRKKKSSNNSSHAMQAS